MTRNKALLLALAAALAGAACSSVTGAGRGQAPACAGPVRPLLPDDRGRTTNDHPAASPAARAAREAP